LNKKIKRPKSTGITQDRKQKKREEAEARNAAYQKLSLDEKLGRQCYLGRVHNRLTND